MVFGVDGDLTSVMKTRQDDVKAESLSRAPEAQVVRDQRDAMARSHDVEELKGLIQGGGAGVVQRRMAGA